jgi:hypothetical protein
MKISVVVCALGAVWRVTACDDGPKGPKHVGVLQRNV